MPLNPTNQTVISRLQAEIYDPQGQVYDVPTLQPFVAAAQDDLVQELRALGATETKAIAYVTLTANTTEITKTSSPALPAGFVQPDWIWEAEVGAAESTFVLLAGPATLPAIPAASTLRYYDWQANKLVFLGATGTRRLKIQYIGRLSDLTNLSDVIEVPDLHTAMVELAKAKIVEGRGDLEAGRVFRQFAERKLYAIATEAVKARQNMPFRRPPYRSQWTGYNWRDS